MGDILGGPTLDENILAQLPPGTTILSIGSAVSSKYVSTAKVNTKQADNSLRSYFLKYISGRGKWGEDMMRGCYQSELDFFTFAPRNIPKPMGWGQCKSMEDTFFFVTEFHEMKDGVPEIHSFCKLTAKIHLESTGKSPGGLKGKFGYPVTTYIGNVPTNNTWCATWQEFFTQAMDSMFEAERNAANAQGIEANDQELRSLFKALKERIIPRLVKPMETDGRTITPCLVHGDLWPGNAKHDTTTNDIIIFDSGACWGHNEADLAEFRAPRYQLGPNFMEEYHRHIPKSEPVEDWDDRNRLYAIRYDLLVSAVFPSQNQWRQYAMEDMKYLVEKYPNGFQG